MTRSVTGWPFSMELQGEKNREGTDGKGNGTDGNGNGNGNGPSVTSRA